MANGKGLALKRTRKGRSTGRKKPAGTIEQYIGGLFHGTLSVIDLPGRDAFETQLRNHTVEAYRCSPLQADARIAIGGQAGNPIPMKVGDPSPIKYCIYIIKENRTYDQVLGDMPEGNGDPSLCLFPEDITRTTPARPRVRPVG